jgi:hypothetical protein
LMLNLTSDELRQKLARAITTAGEAATTATKSGTMSGFRDYALESREAIDR